MEEAALAENEQVRIAEIQRRDGMEQANDGRSGQLGHGSLDDDADAAERGGPLVGKALSLSQAPHRRELGHGPEQAHEILG